MTTWYSRIVVPFLWIEFASPCAKRECSLDWDKRIFFFHQMPYFVSYLSHDFSCTVVLSCLKFLITFLFLGSRALLFQLFHLVTLISCFMQFPFPRSPLSSCGSLDLWLLSRLLLRISLRCSAGLASLFPGCFPCSGHFPQKG